MNRLLHAVARGARIEYLHPKAGWLISGVVLLNRQYPESRIHPDDEHLAYGPISTELREKAQDQYDYTLSVNTNYGGWSAKTGTWIAYGNCRDSFHRSLFLLILAEALADEGL